MNFYKKVVLSIFVILFFTTKTFSQSCSNLNMQWQADITSTCNLMVVTMIHDANNLPYLYVANKEAGLKIYDITSVTSPQLLATVSNTQFDSLDVMNLSQDGNYLYLALGNSFTNPEQGGMAIVDVSNPLLPVVTDYYVVPNSASGGGIINTEGNYAYLGAMKSGLVILDISDKNNIQFVSQFTPDINFPPVTNPNPDLYNARGMEVKNSIVYLCYDAGGIRIINCTNKSNPVETGRWCNPAMYTPFNRPKAYNNCILDDTLLYVTVDYAGLEVLNISDTSNITLTGWWNPYNAPDNNWFSSPSHTNEICYDKNCKRVFMSTGKSDMMVVDVSDPTQPDSCNFYGGVNNNMGTWGIGMWENQIYLSYICAIIPFGSNWTGVKILTYNSCTSDIENNQTQNNISVFPNPFHSTSTISTSVDLNNANLIVYSSQGQEVLRITGIRGKQMELQREKLRNGIYFFTLTDEQNNFSGKFVVE